MKSKKNYGNNIIFSFCGKEYIIGNNMNLSLVIIMTIVYTIILIFWITLLFQLYSLYIFIIGFFLYSLLLYYYLKSFFTEPGIIPRNHPKYILNNSIRNYQKEENDYYSFQTFDNSTKSEINQTDINNSHNILPENIQTEKKNKIFPDFILANSADELKDQNKMNNSINGWTNGSVLGHNIIEQEESIFSNKNNINAIKNKRNSQDILKNDNSSEININNYIPHIFQKRPCKTCNIIRPPKTSHCVICNNCIKELDHHCFYISNCVGIRNRKFFILFLIYGFFLSILSILTSLYHLIFIFIIQKNNKYLTILLFKNYYIQIGISIIIMLIGIVILLFKKESIKLSCAIFIPGNILFDIYFYYSIHKNRVGPKKIFDFQYHPFSICLIYSLLPLFLFVSKYLKRQFKLVGKGLTMKQFFSIKEERNANKKNKELYDYLDSILKRKVRFKNIIKLLFSKQEKSLINIGNLNQIKEEK